MYVYECMLDTCHKTQLTYVNTFNNPIDKVNDPLKSFNTIKYADIGAVLNV
jgi:hypothetical protein